MRWGLGKSQSLALVPFPPNLVCAFLHTGPAVHLSRLSLTGEVRATDSRGSRSSDEWHTWSQEWFFTGRRGGLSLFNVDFIIGERPILPCQLFLFPEVELGAYRCSRRVVNIVFELLLNEAEYRHQFHRVSFFHLFYEHPQQLNSYLLPSEFYWKDDIVVL